MAQQQRKISGINRLNLLNKLGQLNLLLQAAIKTLADPNKSLSTEQLSALLISLSDTLDNTLNRD